MTLEEVLKGMEDEQKEVIQAELDKVKPLEEKIEKLESEKEDSETARGELEKKVEELEKAEPVKEVSTDEELIKSADPKIQELLKKAQDENEKLRKEQEEKAEQEKIEKAELRKEEITKEVEEFTNIGASKEDLVEIFSKIDSDKDLYDKVKTVLKADDEILKANKLTVQVGSTKEPVEKSADEELEEKAKEMVEKDGVTIEKARSIIIKSDPEKYMK